MHRVEFYYRLPLGGGTRIFTPWENIKITLYYKPRMKYNLLQFYTITPAEILHLGINPCHPPSSTYYFVSN